MRLPTAATDEWAHGLAEGVVLIEGERVRFLNAAAGRMLGVEPAWAADKPLINVVRDHRVERAWLERNRLEIELRGRRITVVPMERGLALRDVSEAHRARQDARELLAVLSHELRTPMTTVRATLEALDYDDVSAAERARLLTRAMNEADRVVRLLEDLTVDVAPPRERSVSLADTLARALAILQPILEAGRLEVRYSLAATNVWADPDKVLQVLLNLVENAAVHGPADSVIDVISCRHGDWVLLAVRDFGSMLEPERFERMFEPFARGTSANGRGRGLGLYVVRSIAEAWNGRAWGRGWRGEFSEGPEGGNEFGVMIPVSRESGPPPELGAALASRLGAEDAPARRPADGIASFPGL